MTDRTEQTLEQFQAQRLQESLAKRAVALRTIAERLERTTDRVGRVGSPGISSYGSLATEAVHELIWGVANTNIDLVVQAAADADLARAQGE